NAVHQYEEEKAGRDCDEPAYPHPIFENCLPHCDTFLDNGYTREEMKLVHETRKILAVPDMSITATAVRVPVYGGHSESVNIEFVRPFQMEEVFDALSQTDGLVILDDPATYQYPTPRAARGKNEVFVGRIRRDQSVADGINLWIVADNLRKGAATNAVQIAEYLAEKQFV
ncbi:MAG: Asd/ArgC dimerization domain-containing protein, partial [Saprospiraceae bacterium]|nr:Asd/ArgC dimerization domain-containing protein [Saprospiraceae bacterium]